MVIISPINPKILEISRRINVNTVAIAKNLAEGQDHSIDRIIDLDREIQAKYNKCVQYKSTMINSDNPISIDNAHIRYDITWEDVLTLRDSLDQYVFDK